jgi:hypothetical protein
MARQIGKAISVLIKYERDLNFWYDDMAAFHAPSECYPDDRRLGRMMRVPRHLACRIAGVKNLRQLRREAIRSCPTWDRYNWHRLGIQAI